MAQEQCCTCPTNIAQCKILQIMKLLHLDVPFEKETFENIQRLNSVAGKPEKAEEETGEKKPSKPAVWSCLFQAAAGNPFRAG